MQSEKTDYLEVDKPIPGQNYVCLSFLSPESMIKKKNLYYFDEFRKFYFEKFRVILENIQTELKDNQILSDNLNHILKEDISELYEIFNIHKGAEVEKKFDEENNNACSVHGLKVRGTYSTYDEAQGRAKTLQKKDPHFNVFIGQVGYWLPWDPNPSNMNEEYADEKLNELMREYKSNLEHKNDVWEKMTKERIEMAKKEGLKRDLETDTTDTTESTS